MAADRTTAEGSVPSPEDNPDRTRKWQVRSRSGLVDLTPGITRLAHAWTQANAEFLVGAAQVAGDLFANLNTLAYENLLRERYYEEPQATEPTTARARSRYSRTGEKGTSTMEAGIVEEVSNALTHSADVLARTAAKLTDTYNRATREDAEDAAPTVASEEARPIQKDV